MKPTALFIHISKTGGSSIATAPFIIKQGSPEADPRIAVKDNNLKLSFAFVRNPYTRFTSAVFNHGYTTPEKFNEWVMGEFMQNYAQKFQSWEWQEIIPQHKYLFKRNEETGEQETHVDYIGKLENIESDWKELCKELGEEWELPHINKNKYPDHEKYLTPEIKGIIASVYAHDFNLLGYEM